LKTSSIDSLPNAKLLRLKETSSDLECVESQHQWALYARQEQLAPPGAWRNWLILAGRGFGKTRAGAEWVRRQVKCGAGRIALIAPTLADARDIMVGGESGLLAVCWKGDCTDAGRRLGRPVFQSSRRRLVWPNGAVAMLFSAEEPERLRGPQHERVWADAKTIWGALVSVAATLGAMFGLPVDAGGQAALTEAILQTVSAVAGIVAILGRVSASSRIG
jgi:phage terminase large subunit-like protein